MKLFVLFLLVLPLSACISVNTLEDLKSDSTVSPVYSSNSSFTELESNVYKYIHQCYRSQTSKVKMNGTALGGAIYSINKHQKEDGVDFVVKQWIRGGYFHDSGYHHFLLFSLKQGKEINNYPTVQVHSKVMFNTETIFENVEKTTQGKMAKC